MYNVRCCVNICRVRPRASAIDITNLQLEQLAHPTGFPERVPDLVRGATAAFLIMEIYSTVEYCLEYLYSCLLGEKPVRALLYFPSNSNGFSEENSCSGVRKRTWSCSISALCGRSTIAVKPQRISQQREDDKKRK